MLIATRAPLAPEGFSQFLRCREHLLPPSLNNDRDLNQTRRVGIREEGLMEMNTLHTVHDFRPVLLREYLLNRLTQSNIIDLQFAFS